MLFDKIIIRYLNAEGVNDDIKVVASGSIDQITLIGWKYENGKQKRVTRIIRI